MNFVRFGRVASLVTEKARGEEFRIGLEAIEPELGRLVPNPLTDYQGDGLRFDDGDILFGKLRPYLAKVWLATTSGAAVGDFHVYRPDTVQVHPAYLRWALLSRSFLEPVVASVFGAKMPRASWDFIRTVEVFVPSIDEQRAIADYLDRETAQIDTLIEEQQRLVDLLRERRRAVVERAVFFGLDGAPRTANSESWLPNTPQHWKIVQLGLVSDTLSGFAFPSEGFTQAEEATRLLRGVNIKPGGIDWTETVRWNAAESPIPAEYLLGEGDLVLGMDRPFVGRGVRICALEGKDLPALLLQRVMRIRAHPQGDPAYFRYVATTSAFITYLEPLFTGVSVPHVSEWQVRKFKMPYPPLDEQRRIAAYLDEQTAKIDTLITETEKFIELARERRSALITAAVTGQIDVREQAT